MKKIVQIAIVLGCIFPLQLLAQSTNDSIDYIATKSCYLEHAGDKEKAVSCSQAQVLSLLKAEINPNEIKDWKGSYHTAIGVYSNGKVNVQRVIRSPKWVGKGHETLIEEKLNSIGQELDWMSFFMGDIPKGIIHGSGIPLKINFTELLATDKK